MGRILTISSAAAILAFAALVTGAPVEGRGAAAAPTTRTVRFTAVDAKGVAITDLTAADLAAKEGGKAVTIDKVEAATGPLQVAVLVDDNGSGLFRAGLVSFLNKILNHAEISISSVVGQTMKVVDYTTKMDELRDAVLKLGARPGSNDGGQLLAGLFEATKELQKRNATRPAILVLTVGGPEQAEMQAEQTLDELRKSGAVMNVVSVAAGSIRDPGAKSLDSSMDQNRAIQEVLGDGPKQSGGRHSEIAAMTGVVSQLELLGDELMHQYVVTYTLPDGVKPDKRFELTTKRKGALLHAPTKIQD